MPTDQLGRRMRFKRSPIGKRITLTPRDVKVLRLLYRYRYLRNPQLVAFLRPRSEKRFIERLGDLFHETGLIGRPPVQWRHVDPRSSPLIHELTNAGIDYLDTIGSLPHRATTLSRRTRPGYSPQFLHAMMIVDALAKVELETMQASGQRFVPVDEILARAPDAVQNAPNPLSVPITLRPGQGFADIRKPFQTHIIPDGLYGIEYLIKGEKRYRFWALECERTTPVTRSTAKNSSLKLKQAAYDELLGSKAFKAHWGIPNLKLHWVKPETGQMQAPS